MKYILILIISIIIASIGLFICDVFNLGTKSFIIGWLACSVYEFIAYPIKEML